MGEQTFTEGLLALARREAATPEGRERVTRALREALREVEAPEPIAMLEDLAGRLVMLADQAEWMAEIARGITAPPRA